MCYTEKFEIFKGLLDISSLKVEFKYPSLLKASWVCQGHFSFKISKGHFLNTIGMDHGSINTLIEEYLVLSEKIKGVHTEISIEDLFRDKSTWLNDLESMYNVISSKTVYDVVHDHPKLGRMLSNLIQSPFVASQKDILDVVSKCITFFAVSPFGNVDIPVHDARRKRAKALEWAALNIKNHFIDNASLKELKQHSNSEVYMLTQLGYSQQDMNRIVISQMIQKLIGRVEYLDRSIDKMRHATEQSVLLFHNITTKCALLLKNVEYREILVPLVDKICKSRFMDYITNVKNSRSDISELFVDQIFELKFYDMLDNHTKSILWNKSTYSLNKEIEQLILHSINNFDDITIRIDSIAKSSVNNPAIYYYVMNTFKTLLFRTFHNNLIKLIHMLTKSTVEYVERSNLPSLSIKSYFDFFTWPILPTLIQTPQAEIFRDILKFIEDNNGNAYRCMALRFLFVQFLDWYDLAVKLKQADAVLFVQWFENNMTSNKTYM